MARYTLLIEVADEAGNWQPLVDESVVWAGDPEGLAVYAAAKRIVGLDTTGTDARQFFRVQVWEGVDTTSGEPAATITQNEELLP